MRKSLLFIAPLLLVLPGVSLRAAAPRVELEITPLSPVRVESRGKVLFADFGEDRYANLQLDLPANPPAAKVTVRLGEKLTAEGAIDRNPGKTSISYREVTLSLEPGKQHYKLDIPTKERHKNKAAVHEPDSIGEVAPFRYAEIEGSPVPLDKTQLHQLFVHAPFDDEAASFESSDATLNAVWKLCKHTMKATTAFGIYIDGERERIPYEADAYLNQLSHYACDLDPRVARFTFEHLLDHPTWPTEWSLHMPLMAAADYQATGDPQLAANNWDALKKKLLLDKAGPDGLLHAGGIVDWPEPERDGYNNGKKDPKQGQQVGPEVNTVVNAFYYEALQRMAQLARALGKQDDAADFDARAKQVYAAFNARLFDPARGIYTDGLGSAHASLHANMFPLAFGLVPADRVEKVTAFVQSRGMACSVYGAQYLLEALFQGGHDDYALQLMTGKSDRGWWHMIELGSTMTLEAWDAKYKPNLTWNHAWGAAPANILSRFVLGVRPLEPGYTRILIAPHPGTLDWVKGKVPTAKGPVLVNLTRKPTLKLEVEIPPGSTARVQLPVKPGTTVTLDGKPLDGPVADNVSPGKHVLEAH